MDLHWRLRTPEMMWLAKPSARPQGGQTLVEYALLLLLIAVLLVGAVALFGGSVSQAYSSVVAAWPGG